MKKTISLLFGLSVYLYLHTQTLQKEQTTSKWDLRLYSEEEASES